MTNRVRSSVRQKGLRTKTTRQVRTGWVSDTREELGWVRSRERSKDGDQREKRKTVGTDPECETGRNQRTGVIQRSEGPGVRITDREHKKVPCRNTMDDVHRGKGP